ncbi:MAG: Rieske (2Fe-2S) protein [Hyphomonadaceae bacterium]
MSARAAPGAMLARVNEIPEGGAIAVSGVLLAKRAGVVFAYENQCTHALYPLHRADGGVLVQEGRYIVCAVHAASFELETGACAGGPCNGAGLPAVAVEVRDGAVFMPLPRPVRDPDRDGGA